MTNIFVSQKPIASDPSQDEIRQGMVDAGDQISGLLHGVAGDGKLASSFFDDLWTGLEAYTKNGDVKEGHVTDPGNARHSYFVRPEPTKQFPLNRELQGNKFKYTSTEKYEDNAGDEQDAEVDFTPTCVLDKVDKDGKKPKKRRMTISVPAEANDVINDSYLHQVLTDLSVLGTDEEKVKYLLAVIFLNRCQ